MPEPTTPWQVHLRPTPGRPEVRDTHGHLVATLDGPRSQAALDAVLLAHAPELLAAVEQCATALGVMAEEDPGPSGRLAAHLAARLERLLRGPLSVWQDGGRGGVGDRPADADRAHHRPGGRQA